MANKNVTAERSIRENGKVDYSMKDTAGRLRDFYQLVINLAAQGPGSIKRIAEEAPEKLLVNYKGDSIAKVLVVFGNDDYRLAVACSRDLLLNRDSSYATVAHHAVRNGSKAVKLAVLKVPGVKDQIDGKGMSVFNAALEDGKLSRAEAVLGMYHGFKRTESEEMENLPVE